MWPMTASMAGAAAQGSRPEHESRFLLRLHLQQINALEAAVSEIDREVNERIEPFRTAVELPSRSIAPGPNGPT